MTRNAAGVIVAVGESITELLGWRPDDLVGLPSTRFIHPEDKASAVAAWMAMIVDPGVTSSWRGRYQTAAGEWRWVETTNVADDTDAPNVTSVMRPVAGEIVSAEEELRAREQLLTRLADALPVGVFQIDAERHVTFANDRFHEIVGPHAGATIEAHLRAVVPEDRARLAEAVDAVLSDRPVDHLELRLDLAEAEAPERSCLLSLRPLTSTLGVITGAVGSISDETDGARLRRELEVRATTDDLTRCLNRSATIALLDEMAGSGHVGSAVVFIDLDEFKLVNDTHGHDTGDRVLREAAQRIAAVVRDVDSVGRFGGDEFLVVCPRVASPELAEQIARRIADAVTFTVAAGTVSVDVRASIGVAWTPDAPDPDAMIARADQAMYRAKRGGSALEVQTLD